MVRTQSDREKRREERLKSLPSSERAFRMATIKKKEGRPLNSEERHALRMHGFLGTVYQAATSIRKSVEETVRAEAINEVIELLRPEFTKHCRSPTLTRIIQSCIRCGTPQHLASITSLLTSEDAQSLLTDPCGRHTICSLLRHTTASSFAMYWNNVLIPNACKIVEFQPGLAVLSSAVTAPYSTPGKRGELVLAALISPEERKRLASNSKNIGEERDGHVLPWKSWPLPCSQGPPHRVLQERLRVLSEKLVNKKSCDLIFSHLILETALSAYDAARNEANDSAKTSCPDNSANGSPLSGADSSEWYAEVIEAVREEFLSSSGSTLPLKGMTSARLVLRIFLESSPKSRRNLLQSLHGYAVEYASSVSGAALLSAIIDLNADAQVTYRYIIAPWLERLDELCTPVAFRHFSKLLHRLCIVNAANKNKAVPQLWREVLDLDHIQTPHKLAEDTWNIIAIRHCRLVSRFLVRFIPHVLDLEAKKNLDSSASQSQPRASLLSMGSFRTTLRGIFNQISSLLEMEECDDQLKKYCQSDLQYSSFVQGLKAKKSGTMEGANSVGTTSKGGKRVRKEKSENIPVNKVYEKRVFFESDDDDDENEEVQKGALRNDDTMDEKPPVPKKKRVLKKA